MARLRSQRPLNATFMTASYLTVSYITAVAVLVVSAQSCAGCTAEPATTFEAQESHESELGGGWIGAGQPSEARLREVVALGARVISIRPAVEDPFDEEAIVAEAGGVFVRFPVESSRYSDVTFRESLYDFLDEQMALGGEVYFHCKSSNRVGAAWALYHAERKGVAPAEALVLGQKAGLASLEPTVRDILGL